MSRLWGRWGLGEAEKKEHLEGAAIFRNGSKTHLRGSWGWSAISASAHTFFPLGPGRNPSTPRGCPQRTRAASRQRASGTAHQPPTSFCCPCITSTPSQLPPWYPPASCSRPIHLLPPQTQGKLFQICLLFLLLLSSLLPFPPTHRPRVGMTKEPHGMALPLMEKNEEDVKEPWLRDGPLPGPPSPGSAPSPVRSCGRCRGP
nr:uncharacterized protein LOC104650210 [Saimiri boliviensis boliviensis]